MEPVAGVVRGQVIHLACATEGEKAMTWARFYLPDAAPDRPCDRCQQPLRSDAGED